MLVSPLQLEKAKAPMLFKLFGSVMLVSPSQLEKVEVPMLCKPSGTATFPPDPVYRIKAPFSITKSLSLVNKLDAEIPFEMPVLFSFEAAA